MFSTMKHLVNLRFFSFFLLLLCSSCQGQSAKWGEQKANNKETLLFIQSEKLDETYDVAYFASGCFWCVEAIFEAVKGVEESISGYSGGHTDFVNYDLSNTGKTGHAEAVKIYYNSEIVSFETLVDVYFASQNVFQKNGQGPDIGSQYRSILFYQNDEEKEIIQRKMNKIEEESGKKVAAEVQKFNQFFVAEDDHQDYKKKHPDNPYIKSVSNPRFKQFAEKLPGLLK